MSQIEKAKIYARENKYKLDVSDSIYTSHLNNDKNTFQIAMMLLKGTPLYHSYGETKDKLS